MRAIPVAQRDWYEDWYHYPIDTLAAACKELPQARGDHGQQDIVDFRVVGMCDTLDRFEAAANDRKGAVRTDPTVQAGVRSCRLRDDLTDRRPRGQHTSCAAHRVREHR